MKKNISISIFQIFIFLLISIAIVVIAVVVKKNVNFAEISISKRDDSFSGSGTNQDPYKIEKIEDLVKLSQNVNKGNTYSEQYFELVNKIDFQSDESYANANSKIGDINKDGKTESIKTELTTGRGFQPIGNTIEHYFDGIFNGNDKTIKNLSINISEVDEYTLTGLFGNNKGTIFNLKVDGDINISENIENAKIYIGMISAKNEGKIQACKAEGNIYSVVKGNNSLVEVAGIASENTGKIIDSASSVNITSNQLKGGIVAKNSVTEEVQESGEIINCTNDGTIKETEGTDYFTAGIASENHGGNITSCNNNGIIEARKAGGIAGNSTGHIVACQNSGVITNIKEDSNDNEYAGGIVAILDTATIENCKNTAQIFGLTNIGGIVGENKGTILQSKNEGSISKISDKIGKMVNIGGIVGKNNATSKISNSKNYGSVSSEADNLVNLGGICGVMYNNSVIENCENNGGLKGIAKIITPNEDLSIKCTSCINNSGGSADTADFGELNIGIIYGKFEEK